LVDLKSEDPMHPHLSYVDLTYEGVMDLCYGAHLGHFSGALQKKLIKKDARFGRIFILDLSFQFHCKALKLK